jgi:heme exporter protein CcmD
MAEFLKMGGYAVFIWPSWGIASFVIVVISLQALTKARKIRRSVEAKEGHGRG